MAQEKEIKNFKVENTAKTPEEADRMFLSAVWNMIPFI